MRRDTWKLITPLALALLVSACGGGSSSASAPSTPDTQTRTDAVNQTVADNSDCTSLTPFYWEIGDKDGALASGTGGDGSSTPPTTDTVLSIASASKWIFASWVLEDLSQTTTLPPTADQVSKLNFTSGYDQLNNAVCILGSNMDTVDDCLTASNGSGGYNNDQTSADIGKFNYNGGHMQQLAHDLGLSGDYVNSVATASDTPKLNATIAADISALPNPPSTSFLYTNPMLSGGADTSATVYAGFLRAILSDDLLMHDYLSADAVCAWPHNTDCNAIYSPVNMSSTTATSNDVSNEKWHYSLGHWIEDDPTVGDGAFSSPGAEGFYPWIDKTMTWYGILARQQSSGTGNSIGVASVFCGRMMRKAWVTGQAQLTSPTP